MVIGGPDRQDSVKNAIQNSNPNIDLVVIHDAARPFITKTLIEQCIFACETSDGAIIAMQPYDTIKFSKDNIVEKLLTDQIFGWPRLLRLLINKNIRSL